MFAPGLRTAGGAGPGTLVRPAGALWVPTVRAGPRVVGSRVRSVCRPSGPAPSRLSAGGGCTGGWAGGLPATGTPMPGTARETTSGSCCGQRTSPNYVSAERRKSAPAGKDAHTQSSEHRRRTGLSQWRSGPGHGQTWCHRVTVTPCTGRPLQGEKRTASGAQSCLRVGAATGRW